MKRKRKWSVELCCARCHITVRAWTAEGAEAPVPPLQEWCPRCRTLGPVRGNVREVKPARRAG